VKRNQEDARCVLEEGYCATGVQDTGIGATLAIRDQLPLWEELSIRACVGHQIDEVVDEVVR
jgi:hypothetical protein